MSGAFRSARRPGDDVRPDAPALAELRSRITLPETGFYLIGLSGGADSVALLLLLLPAVREGRLRVEAVHVNHGLRGEASGEDERFVRSLCERWGVPLHVYRADLRGRRDEDAARRARYAFFRQAAGSLGVDGLLLAHHADDQAETFLLRLLRGAGPDGLECMKETATVEGLTILRPLLPLRRSEIREALRLAGIPWREDETNQEPTYLRNRVRLELIPALQAFSPAAVAHLCAAAGLIAEENEVLRQQAESILAETATGDRLEAQLLRELPPALQSRVLRLWWQRQGHHLRERQLSLAQCRQLAGLLSREQGRVNLPGDTYGVRAGRYLYLVSAPPAPPEPVRVSGPETRFGDHVLRVTPSQGNPGDGRRAQEVPQGFAEGCELRTRRPGDRIRPFGHSGRRKLQDYLTDRKIPRHYRDRIPLLCRGEEVLLVCGVGAGDIPRWDSADHPVRLTWVGEMPWAAEDE